MTMGQFDFEGHALCREQTKSDHLVPLGGSPDDLNYLRPSPATENTCSPPRSEKADERRGGHAALRRMAMIRKPKLPATASRHGAHDPAQELEEAGGHRASAVIGVPMRWHSIHRTKFLKGTRAMMQQWADYLDSSRRVRT